MSRADYIEREAVNDLIKAECSPKVAAYLIDAVATIPAADVRENAKARWIDMGDHLLCSGCGATHYGADKNFCPHCGADMRQTGDENV